MHFLKKLSEIEPRKIMPLPLIAVPWGIIPESTGRGHCKNSIPHSGYLDVMMEPVLYLPRTVTSNRSRTCEDVTEKKETFQKQLRVVSSKESFEGRNHLTSAYR